MKYEFRIKAGVIAALFFALSVHASAAQAAGIEVSPARLEMSVGNKPVTSRIQVKNPTNDVQLYEVSLNTDDSTIAIGPKSFTVQAGGSQEVQIRVEPKDSTEFSGEVQIVGRPLAVSGNEIGSGVKLPLVIHYGAHSVWYYSLGIWATVGIVLIIILLLAAVLAKRRKA